MENERIQLNKYFQNPNPSKQKYIKKLNWKGGSGACSGNKAMKVFGTVKLFKSPKPKIRIKEQLKGNDEGNLTWIMLC